MSVSLFVSVVFVRCGGLPQSSQQRVFPGPGLSRALSVWGNSGGLLQPQTHQNPPLPAGAHHRPVRVTHLSLQTPLATPSVIHGIIGHLRSHLTNSFGVPLSPRPRSSLLSSDYRGLVPSWVVWVNVQGLSQAISHCFPWAALVRVTMCLPLCWCVEDTSGFSLCSPINSSHLSHSLFLSLCLSVAQWLQLALASAAAYL